MSVPVLTLIILLSASAGYPLIDFFSKHDFSTFGAFNLGGINASGQVRYYVRPL
jgi:hypothetical protein